MFDNYGKVERTIFYISRVFKLDKHRFETFDIFNTRVAILYFVAIYQGVEFATC